MSKKDQENRFGQECGWCRFWEVPEKYGHSAGLCKRYAPRPFLTKTDYDYDQGPERNANWPITGSSDWCGEFVGLIYDADGETPLIISDKDAMIRHLTNLLDSKPKSG